MKTADKLKVIDKILTDWAEWYADKTDIDHGILTALLSVCSIEEDDSKERDAEITAKMLKQLGMDDEEVLEFYKKLISNGCPPNIVIQSLTELSEEDHDVKNNYGGYPGFVEDSNNGE